MKIELGILISIISVICVIATLIINTSKGNRQDGINQGKIDNDMQYMKRGIDNIALEIKDLVREQGRIKEQQIIDRHDTIKANELAERAMKSAKEAHVRIDKIKEEK